MSEPASTRPIVGVLWMVLTGLLFVCVTALVKYMGPTIPAEEAAFLRYSLGLVLLIPMLPAVRAAKMTKRLWQLIILRGVVHTIAVSLWFYAMARIAIADVTALNYLSPVYVTLGAAIFLGEKLALRRILAVLAALVGAIIILRPGMREISTGHIAMLIAAVFFAAGYLSAKQMSGSLHPAVVVVALSVSVSIGLAPLAARVWVTPSLHDVGILFAVACVATLGHYTMTLAFQAAPVTVTQPVTFLQLIWAVSLGYFVFDEGVDVWVIMGGAIILGAISFMTWREAVAKRRQTTPSVVETKV